MIFVDTSAWLALSDSHDRHHGEARELHRRIVNGKFGKQVTTNYVLVETLSIVRRRIGLPAAVSLAKIVRESKEVELYWVEPVHHQEAIKLMATRPDKQWSVTDCSSFVVMQSLGIQDAFAFDLDFSQAGFSTHP